MARKAAPKKVPRADVGETTARTETNRAKALSMLLAGKSCPQIGEALGCSRVWAWTLCKEAMQDLIAETMDKAEQWRAILSQKALEQLGKGEALRDKSLNGLDKEDGKVDLDMLETANSMINAAHEKLAKLWGAYAATKVETKSQVQADVTSNGSTVGAAAAVANLSDEALQAIRQAHLLAAQAAQQ